MCLLGDAIASQVDDQINYCSWPNIPTREHNHLHHLGDALSWFLYLLTSPSLFLAEDPFLQGRGPKD